MWKDGDMGDRNVYKIDRDVIWEKESYCNYSTKSFLDAQSNQARLDVFKIHKVNL